MFGRVFDHEFTVSCQLDCYFYVVVCLTLVWLLVVCWTVIFMCGCSPVQSCFGHCSLDELLLLSSCESLRGHVFVNNLTLFTS